MITGPFTPDSPGLMLDFLDSFSKRDEDYVHKIIVEHYSINMRVMKLLGQWQIKNRKATAAHCRGVVICVENIKGFQLVLNSLLNITPTNFPIEIVNTKDEADVWAQERLHEKKKRR